MLSGVVDWSRETRENTRAQYIIGDENTFFPARINQALSDAGEVASHAQLRAETALRRSWVLLRVVLPRLPSRWGSLAQAAEAAECPERGGKIEETGDCVCLRFVCCACVRVCVGWLGVCVCLVGGKPTRMCASRGGREECKTSECERDRAYTPYPGVSRDFSPLQPDRRSVLGKGETDAYNEGGRNSNGGVDANARQCMCVCHVCVCVRAGGGGGGGLVNKV